MGKELEMPKLGQGTWYLGENKAKEQQEIEALQTGIEQGVYMIDTAEMYGNGKAEQLVGKAIKGYEREKLYLVSKVYPYHAGRDCIFDACEASLKRMGTSYLDLYLLHWRGSVPLIETVECMEELVARGKIKRWGVSNFDTADMEELFSVPNGEKCKANQVLYHLGSRGIEYDLLPWLQKHEVQTMAYCPLAQGGDLCRALVTSEEIEQITKKYGITVAQLLLAFAMREKSVSAIPRTGNCAHTLENAKALDVTLTKEDIKILSTRFPAPKSKTYLDIV